MASIHSQTSGKGYSNFDVAIYARVYEVLKMADPDWLRSRFDVMQRYLKVDKVYLPRSSIESIPVQRRVIPSAVTNTCSHTMATRSSDTSMRSRPGQTAVVGWTRAACATSTGTPNSSG